MNLAKSTRLLLTVAIATHPESELIFWERHSPRSVPAGFQTAVIRCNISYSIASTSLCRLRVVTGLVLESAGSTHELPAPSTLHRGGGHLDRPTARTTRSRSPEAPRPPPTSRKPTCRSGMAALPYPNPSLSEMADPESQPEPIQTSETQPQTPKQHPPHKTTARQIILTIMFARPLPVHTTPHHTAPHKLTAPPASAPASCSPASTPPSSRPRSSPSRPSTTTTRTRRGLSSGIS